MATTAHSLGLGIGLKNGGSMITELEPHFDWFVTERCNGQYLQLSIKALTSSGTTLA